jgi:modulator of FtsH protease HflK
MRRFLLLLTVIAAAAFTAWSCCTQVDPGERGVVLRLGRVVTTVEPGLYVGLPWGIDRVERVAVDRVRRVLLGFTSSDSDDLGLAIPPGQLLTGDHNLVDVQVVVEYAVKDSDMEVQQFVLYGDQADGLVGRVAETVLAEWVAGRGVDDVLLRGKEILPRWLVARTQERIAPYALGVRIQLASVNHLYPPRQVKDAFEAVTRAQTEIQTQEFVARQEADARWSEALAYKFRLEQLAAVYATGVKNVARAEADAFGKRLEALATARKENPDYLAALWWDEVTKLYTAMRAAGRLDLLDNRLSADGLDILQSPLPQKKK